MAGGAIVVTNSTVSENTAEGDGGGIFIRSSNGDAQRITSSTIALNTSGGDGGGVNTGSDSSGSLLIQNSIVAANVDSGVAPDLDATRVIGEWVLESSLIGDNTGTMLVEAQVADGLGNLIGAPSPGGGVIDPLLGPLIRGGGFAPTHALLAGSPAIDAGDPLALGELQTDQRGVLFARVSGAAPDMGSVETQTLDADVLTVTTSDDELDYSNATLSLREALELSSGSVGVDTIVFDEVVFSQPASIDLLLGELEIGESVVIMGPGRDLLTIDAAGQFASLSRHGCRRQRYAARHDGRGWQHVR